MQQTQRLSVKATVRTMKARNKGLGQSGVHTDRHAAQLRKQRSAQEKARKGLGLGGLRTQTDTSPIAVKAAGRAREGEKVCGAGVNRKGEQADNTPQRSWPAGPTWAHSSFL